MPTFFPTVAFETPLTLLSAACTFFEQPEAHRKVIVDIYDEEDLGDDRLTPETLRLLLESRQDLAIMLYECAIEEGLVSADDKFYNDEPEGQSYES